MGWLKGDQSGAAASSFVTRLSFVELDGAQLLFVEYAKTLNVALRLHNFDPGLQHLPGEYAARGEASFWQPS